SIACLCFVSFAATESGQPANEHRVARFSVRPGGLELERPARAGAFFHVAGRRAALMGYENRPAEAWIYPLEIIDGFSLSFRLEGYPLDIDGRDILASIRVRPEATTLLYAHAACTVRQT